MRSILEDDEILHSVTSCGQLEPYPYTRVGEGSVHPCPWCGHDDDALDKVNLSSPGPYTCDGCSKTFKAVLVKDEIYHVGRLTEKDWRYIEWFCVKREVERLK